MKYVEMAEKIHTRINAKLKALIEMEKGALDYFIEGPITLEGITGVLTSIASIATAVSPIVLQVIGIRGRCKTKTRKNLTNLGLCMYVCAG